MGLEVTLVVAPELLRPVNTAQTLRQAQYGELRPVSERVLSDLSSTTRGQGAESLAASYEVDLEEARDGASFVFRNRSNIWVFWEKDTKPHMPPFGPGSELAKWAAKRNMRPFPVALKIAREGTKGHHVASRVLEDHEQAAYEAMGRGLGKWIGALGSP